jgi:hypothetical protein
MLARWVLHRDRHACRRSTDDIPKLRRRPRFHGAQLRALLKTRAEFTLGELRRAKVSLRVLSDLDQLGLLTIDYAVGRVRPLTFV